MIDHHPSGAALAELDLLCVNTVRTLSIDAVQRANSGHPGAPMGLAPTAYALWQQFLRYDPEDPTWPNRDRFVLSNGHASMLLYSLLFLAGVRERDGQEPGGPAVSMEDIQAFRQAGSRCPGHPEYGMTAGVEATTGPLGQGLADSVGMAIAERWLAATYNRPGFEVFDHRVWALCGDGCLMEGISGEAASLAGHLRLGNLCWVFDNNHVTIEGDTALAFTEDVGARFRAYGWHVLHVTDGNDLEALGTAYAQARDTSDMPTLIIVDTHIGYGDPNVQDTAKAHGEPLGAEGVQQAKRSYGWPPEAEFLVPDGVLEHFAAGIGARGAEAHRAWDALLLRYREAHPDLAAQLDRMWQRTLPAGWDADLPAFPADARGLSTREASGRVLNAIAPHVPWLIGGAADLAPSTRTRLEFAGAGDFAAPDRGGAYDGRNLHFGVREHAMCAVVNGMALSGVRPYAAGFLIFTDYARPAIRLSALMEIPVIHVWTHDSISLGQDGPTHQPIEQIASFRAMPGMLLIRPADANEVTEAWRLVMALRDRPAMLVLTRQALPVVDRAVLAPATGLARGAYVLADAPSGTPDVILIASGSEVPLCLEARDALAAEGVQARVVSMPCWELFEAQDRAYRDAVLPPAITARVAVEEASPFGWERYTGPGGTILGMDTFGMSAPADVVQRHFGFDPGHIVGAAQALLARS